MTNYEPKTSRHATLMNTEIDLLIAACCERHDKTFPIILYKIILYMVI